MTPIHVIGQLTTGEFVYNASTPLYDVNLHTSSQENQSIESLLTATLGQRYRSQVEAISLTIVYCVIFLTGLIGNLCTCIVISRNIHMHSATNYYLFTLAVSDILTLVLGLPPELYTVWEAYPWRFGEAYCILKTTLTETTSSVSCLTITAFTLERYIAICHPLKAQSFSSPKRALRVILVIVMSSFICSLPYPLTTRIYHYLHHPITGISIADSLICNTSPQWIGLMQYVFQVTTFLLFILPMIAISLLYARIGLALRRSDNRPERRHSTRTLKSSGTRSTMLGSRKSTQGVKRRPIIRMLGHLLGRKSRKKQTYREGVMQIYLVAVVVAFFICWAPFHAQRLMTAYVHHWTPQLLELQSALFYISGVLYFVSSTVNPILYNLMSKKYRDAFRETLCRCGKRCDNRHYPNHSIITRSQTGYTKSFQMRSTANQSMTNHSMTKVRLPGDVTENLIRLQ